LGKGNTLYLKKIHGIGEETMIKEKDRIKTEVLYLRDLVDVFRKRLDSLITSLEDEK